MKFNITVSGTYNGVKLNDSLCRFVESVYPFIYNYELDVRCSKKVYSYATKYVDYECNDLFQKSVEILEDIVEMKELYDSDIKKNIDLYLSRDRNLFNIQCLVNNVAFICYDLINTSESYKDIVLNYWFNFIRAISHSIFNSVTNITFENNILDIEFSSKFNKNTRYSNVIISSIVYNIMNMYSETYEYGIDCTHTVSGWVEGAMNEPILC